MNAAPLSRIVVGFALALAAAPLLLAPAASAHSFKLGSIEIGHVWAPPGDGPSFAVYGPLFQSGSTPDRLIGASSPLGKAVEIQDKGGATKSWDDGIALKPGEPVSLASFGNHLEVTGASRPLKEGDTFPLTLSFEHAGSITVEIEVEKTPGE
jgi:copper(I)-binding protein